MTWDQFFAWLMDQEGRVVTNDPSDPGGQTCWGISRRYHPQWPGWPLVDAGVTSVDKIGPLVSEFYRTLLRPYWDALPVRLAPAVCDAVVNMGAGRFGDDDLGAIELLQSALNRLAGSDYVTVDGDMGPRTMDAVAHENPAALAMTLCALRMAEYVRRSRRDPGKKIFLSGWLNRVSSLMQHI